MPSNQMVSMFRDIRQIVAHVIEITPEQAKAWLDLNTSNRRLKGRQIRAFASDMQAGRWAFNGEAIKFAGTYDDPTKLLDGQNRLHAIVLAGVPVRMLVVFGVDPSAQSTMDSGAKRTAADNLAIQGVTNTNLVAAAAALALRVKNGAISNAEISTNAAIEDFVYENPEIIQSATIAARYSSRADMRGRVVAYTHWVLSKIDSEEATRFWRDAAEKVGLEKGDPIIALANRFSDARRRNEQIRDNAALSAIYRVWNHRRAGTPLLVLPIRGRDGSTFEIPVPR